MMVLNWIDGAKIRFLSIMCGNMHLFEGALLCKASKKSVLTKSMETRLSDREADKWGDVKLIDNYCINIHLLDNSVPCLYKISPCGQNVKKKLYHSLIK